jgi:serine/threonine-protein kinase
MGGMADVFLTVAHGPQGVNKLAVVKRLRNLDDPLSTEMFLDEGRLAARLNHPNIVHTYEVGETSGGFFIAMEYLDGQPLNRVVKALDERCEGLPEPFVAWIAIQALKGLHHAHEFCDFDGTPLGVVHRDVSPHNLFVTYGGEIKLLDFGIAKAALNMTHTEDGVLKGKVRYMAPEQALQRDVDRRVDIFAFGVVLWEMLARRGLFTGNAVTILTRLVNEEIPPVRNVRPDVSPALEAIVLKAVRRNPDERYATAEEMRLDLEAYLRGRSDTVSERDLGRLMNELFATIRDEVRARIKAYTATLPSGRIPLSAELTGTGNLPVLPSWSQTPSALAAPPVPTQTTETAAPSPPPVARPSRWSLWLVLVIAAGAGLFVWGSSRRWSIGTLVSGDTAPATRAVPSAEPSRPPVPPVPPMQNAPAAFAASTTSAASTATASTAYAAPAASSAIIPSASPSHAGHQAHVGGPAGPAPAVSIAPIAPAPIAPAPSASAPQQPKIRMFDESDSQ